MGLTGVPPAPSVRYHFVDLLRGWAVLVMIETHVVNALLRPSIKEDIPFQVLTFINGLVAPSFLCCAGFALAITLDRKFDDFIGMRRPLWRYILRIGFIFLVAYMLHLPHFSLQKLIAIGSMDEWIPFFQSDILHVIALTLLAVVLLAVMLRRRSLLPGGVTAAGVVIVFAAPAVYAMDLSMQPVWFRPFLSPEYHSQFPLFPWSAFLLTGVVIGSGFIRAHAKGDDGRFMRQIVILSMAGIACSLFAEALPFSVYGKHDFWKGSPVFFFIRLGLVGLVLATIWRLGSKGRDSGHSPVALFGQESLLVYVVHLLIVYGHTYPWSLIRLFGGELDYAGAALWFVVVTLLMIVLAFGWHRLKARSKRWASVTQYAVYTAIALQLILQ